MSAIPEYVEAVISNDQGGSHAGESVQILADDYTSKGDEELIETKIGDDLVFIEKKFLTLKKEALQNASEDFTVPETTSISGVGNVKEEDEDDEITISLNDLLDSDDDNNDEDKDDDNVEISIEDLDDEDAEPESKAEELEVLQAKLRKTLDELEDVKAEMKNTFTSTETISNTITSLKGMLDAMRKDQMNLK